MADDGKSGDDGIDDKVKHSDDVLEDETTSVDTRLVLTNDFAAVILVIGLLIVLIAPMFMGGKVPQSIRTVFATVMGMAAHWLFEGKNKCKGKGKPKQPPR